MSKERATIHARSEAEFPRCIARAMELREQRERAEKRRKSTQSDTHGQVERGR